MKPRMSLLDRRFKYRDSANTDVRETWRRARRRAALVERIERRKSAPAAAAAPRPASAEVLQLKKSHGGA